MKKIAEYFPDLTSKTASEVDLKYWAVKCATDYLNGNVPLNTNIQNIVRDNGLNKEHVKRISEMANTEVFQRKFDTDEDKNVYFDVADPNKINEESPLNKRTEALDYATAPSYEVGNQNEKIAHSVEWDVGDTHMDPMLDLLELKTDLTRINQDVTDSLTMDTLREKLARDNLFQIAAQSLSDLSFGKIAQAIYETEPSVLDDLTYDLLVNEKIAKQDIKITKISSNINTSHDLIKAAQEYKTLRTKVETLKEAAKEVDSYLNKLSYKIKELKETK